MKYTNKKLKILSLVVTVLVTTSSFPVFASKVYSDIPTGFWAENPADVLSELDIMQGASATEFGGNLPLNRYETARVLSGLLGNRAPIGIILLSDVRQGNPDFKSVMKVVNAQIMEPTNNKFSGEKKITRYEFANNVMKTLDYLQAEPLSIRQKPKSIDAPKEKKAILEKIVNIWQLTDGYSDWSGIISRYEALEIVARAAIILNPELKARLGEVSRSGVAPVSTPTPVMPIYTPIPTPEVPVYTPIPTPVMPVYTPIPTPIPTPVMPIYTPIPTPIVPLPTPIMPVYTPIPTPIVPVPTPIIPNNVTPTPIVTQPVNPILTKTGDILKNNITARGLYNTYNETIPDTTFAAAIKAGSEKVTKFSDTLGPSVAIDGSFWLKDVIDNPILKETGVLFGGSMLGSYLYPTKTSTTKSDTEISETFRGYLSYVYKFYKASDMEVAGGLDGYIRMTDRNPAKPEVNTYWKASKSYYGVGGKVLGAYKVSNELKIEGALGIHYVSQNLNEKINYGTKPQEVYIDRFDIDADIVAKYDLFKYDKFGIYGSGALWYRNLIGDGSQSIIGFGAGVGSSY